MKKKDFFEILQEEARARRAALRDDGEPLHLALARCRQEALSPLSAARRWYLPAAGAALGALSIMAVVFIDFEGKIQQTARDAAQAVSLHEPAPPTFVLGSAPSLQIASKSYIAPVRVINTMPMADRVAIQLKRDDPRLLKPLPGAWRQVTLRRLAAEIKLRTGIPMSVTPELAEQRVTIFSGEKASTLQILRGVAHLYGSGWFRSEPGPSYTYRLCAFDTPQTRGWLNALYHAPERHAPGMTEQLELNAPTHIEWLERLHEATGRTIISDDTNLDRTVACNPQQSLFRALCSQASSAGQVWDSHAEALTFRKASPIGESLLPVRRQ